MTHGDRRDDLQALKKRFDGLADEVRNVHEIWRAILSGASNSNHSIMQADLIDRELKIFAELQRVLTSTYRIMGARLKELGKLV